MSYVNNMSYVDYMSIFLNRLKHFFLFLKTLVLYKTLLIYKDGKPKLIKTNILRENTSILCKRNNF